MLPQVYAPLLSLFPSLVSLSLCEKGACNRAAQTAFFLLYACLPTYREKGSAFPLSLVFMYLSSNARVSFALASPLLPQTNRKAALVQYRGRTKYKHRRHESRPNKFNPTSLSLFALRGRWMERRVHRRHMYEGKNSGGRISHVVVRTPSLYISTNRQAGMAKRVRSR